MIFMSGLNEITTIIDAAKEYADKKNNWIILPLHSSLSIADQDKVRTFTKKNLCTGSKLFSIISVGF